MATGVIGLTGNLAFGSVPVGSAATSTFTINNSGSSTLRVTGISASNGLNSVLLPGWLGGLIPAGNSQQVVVEFAPTAAQNYSGAITIVSAPASGVNMISVVGTGTTVTPVKVLQYSVWGGPDYSLYLGFFACVFCVESKTDSINNQFGIYGSQFSSLSIRNQFSPYGSPSSTDSACNQFATNPPRVYNADQSLFYGELTLNQSRSGAFMTPALVSWLAESVCAH